MLFPRSYAWTPLRRWPVISAALVTTALFAALVYIYECYYRGPGQSALFGTWECTSGCNYHIRFRLNPDHNVQTLDEDGATVIYHGRWYAGGDFLYLRFIGENIPQKHPITVWRTEDLSPSEMRLRSGDILHTMTRVSPASPQTHLTDRWSQPLSAVMTRFNFVKQSPMFGTLVAASGGSAPSR